MEIMVPKITARTVMPCVAVKTSCPASLSICSGNALILVLSLKLKNNSIRSSENVHKSQSKDDGSTHGGKFIDTIGPQPIFSPAYYILTIS
jgi:hypothetical protein